MLLHVMFKDLRYYGQFLIICILTAFESLRLSNTFSAMPKANGVPTATGSVNLDTKLSRMKHDIYSHLIAETKTQLKSLDTQLKDGLDGQIKKAVNEQQGSQDRVSQLMSKIKSAIQTSEAHTKSELTAQITRTVQTEVAKAMTLFKESQAEAKSSEPSAPAPAPASREIDNKRIEIVEKQLQNLTEIVMGSLKVMDKILLRWGEQLDTEMEAKRHTFEEEWREQIDFTQQALAVQVGNLTETHSRLQELYMVVNRMRFGTQLETTDLRDYRDEPPEEVWPDLIDTPARALQQKNGEEADTNIIDLDDDEGSDADTEKIGERGDLPQSLTDWFAGPSLPKPGNDELYVDVARSNNQHHPNTNSAQIKLSTAPALVRDESHVDTANHDGHHDPVSGFKQSYFNLRGRYTKVDPEGICLRG